MADVAVIVPVLNRPQNAARFMESLRATTDWGHVRVFAMTSDDDKATIDAWVAELHDEDGDLRGGLTIGGPLGVHTFAEKVNAMIRKTDPATGRWVFITGDDVVFHPGWVEEAMKVANETGAKVIGTAGSVGISDTFSPHLFIERRYIDELGASWDGPGVVCHEGYRHNYVDLEIIRVARSRGVWAMAWNSIVEHMHPFFGKGEDDPTYRLGQASVDQDAAIWNARQAKYAVTA